MARTYEIRTYGCQMNVHDSERLAGLLEDAGYDRAADGARADLVVFNTCAVRENADNRLYGNLGHLYPAKAANPDGAHAFVNYLLEPEVGARVVDAAHYASANLAAREKVRPEILKDPVIYPPDDVLKRCEFMEHDARTAAVLAAFWREIKGQ